MTEKFEKTAVHFRVKENIYVAEDGRTVVASTDKRVAFLKYGIGKVISPAQHAALIFPGGNTAEPVPDASERSADVIPDAEKRGRKAK